MPVKYNKIKEVMQRQGRTGRWLADQLEVSPLTVSRWYRNVQQPPVVTLFVIADLLDVEVAELLATRADARGEGKDSRT